jgi:prophage maintenance system killer protein
VTETFSPFEIEQMILDNKRAVERRGEHFDVDGEILSHIFSNVNSFNDIIDKRARIIKKAAHLLGGISYCQPFNETNKETALAWTILFLRRNGFHLIIQNTNEKKDIYDLIYKTLMKFEDDSTIISEIEDYMSDRVVSMY